MMPLQIATAQLALMMGAHVVDRIRDPIDANDGELAPFRTNDDAPTFQKFRRSEQVDEVHFTAALMALNSGPPALSRASNNAASTVVIIAPASRHNPSPAS